MGLPLKEGTGGEEVSLLQKKLGLTPNGHFGSGTKAAVLKWQKAHKHPADGVVGEKMWAALFPELAAAAGAKSALGTVGAAVKKAALMVWKPDVQPNCIGENDGQYTYGPSICDGIMAVCVGLGDDTVSTIRLGTSSPNPPFHIPGKLVADPCLIKTAAGFDVFMTVGNADGKRNGVIVAKADHSGIFAAGHTVVIPQTDNAATYGTGQPSVAVNPATGEHIMAVRVDRQDVPGDETHIFRMSSPTTIGPRISTNGDVIDGASTEISHWNGRLVMLVAGGGWLGFRQFEWQSDGSLRRMRELESSSFGAINPLAVQAGIDGAGVERDRTNQMIVTDGNRVAVWRGFGNPTNPGTWGVRREILALP